MAALEVLVAEDDDRSRCMATLVAAFVADPLMRWMFPDPEQYFETMPGIGSSHGGDQALAGGTAFRAADFGAAAFWLPAGEGVDEEAVGEMVQRATDPAIHEDLFGFFELIGEVHPDFDHWYLPTIGVDPVRQGQGYGSGLLAHSLELVDADGLPAYLESSSARNIPLYQRFGFQVVAEIQFGASPTVWPMLRPARES